MGMQMDRRGSLLAAGAAAPASAVPKRLLAQAMASETWKMAPAIPKAMGEVIGAADDCDMYLFGSLNGAYGELPYGTAYRFVAETSGGSRYVACRSPHVSPSSSTSGGRL